LGRFTIKLPEMVFRAGFRFLLAGLSSRVGYDTMETLTTQPPPCFRLRFFFDLHGEAGSVIRARKFIVPKTEIGAETLAGSQHILAPVFDAPNFDGRITGLPGLKDRASGDHVGKSSLNAKARSSRSTT
jgi:hypothetical protein